jgi:glycosyltransferase involved in cell wall biosynthesis
MNENLVSIIIPIYNRKYLISETLESILLQTYCNWECILIDDHSTDETFNVLLNFSEKDSRIRIYKRPFYLKKGANSCRNYGFELSKGKYIQWFDSDDIMKPKMIEEKISRFIVSDFDIVICRLGFFTLDKLNYFIDQRKDLLCKDSNLPFQFFAGDFWFGTPQPMFKKKIS